MPTKGSHRHSPATVGGTARPGPAGPGLLGRRHGNRTTAALVVFAVALALRLLHVWQIRRAPFFDLKLGDAAAYDAWARRIAAGDWIGHDVFYQAPLYPYVLALVYKTIGSSPLILRLLQAIVSAISCVLVGDAGRRLFGATAGLIAGLMLAAYPPAIFLDTLIQKSVLDLFFLALALWVVSRLLTGDTRRSTWLQLGAILGCLSLTRENAAILIVPPLLWLARQHALAPVERARRAALLLGGVAAILAPVAARNWIVGHELVLTTSQLGPNLYIGNNEQANGTYRPLRRARQTPEFEQQDAALLAEQAAGRHLTPGEVSSYYTGQVLEFVRTRPGTWLRLLGRKFVLAWNAVEISDTEDQYTCAQWSWPAALATVWHFGILAPLAALGLWITAKEWRRLWLLHLMAAAYLATLVIFYVFARYRFPLVPFLILFAAAGVARARLFLATESASRLIVCAEIVGAVALLANFPLVAVTQLEATTHYNVGAGLERRGDRAASREEYRAAVDLDPTLALAHSALGRALERDGRVSEAASEFERALDLAPDAATHNDLAVALGRQGKYDEAITHLHEAVRLAPADVDAHRNLASLLATRGHPADAAAEYRRALQLVPDDIALHRALAVVLVEDGNTRDAVDVLHDAVQRSPADAQVRTELARTLAQCGRFDEAATHLRAAIELAPDRADLHNNLGVLLAQHGQLAAAANEFDRALALKPDDVQVRRNLERLSSMRR